jgi:hypothetical protein
VARRRRPIVFRGGRKLKQNVQKRWFSSDGARLLQLSSAPAVARLACHYVPAIAAYFPSQRSRKLITVQVSELDEEITVISVHRVRTWRRTYPSEAASEPAA